MKYEESITRIEEIIKKLDDNTPLDEGIELFSESLKLTTECIEKLNSAKGKITEISSKLNEIIEKELDY